MEIKFDYLRVVFILMAVVVVMSALNQYLLFSVTGTGKVGFFSFGGSSESINGVIPTGIPRIYGNELGISFDDVSPNNPSLADATIRKLGVYDTSITLTGEKLQRYINIASQISCEYCCGAESIIFTNGQAACGCAHSYAMRGVAKYLLDKHADEFTDNQILEELGKWKVLFFPSNAIQKAEILKEKGIEINYINLASNKYRGIEQGASSGSMVGGC